MDRSQAQEPLALMADETPIEQDKPYDPTTTAENPNRQGPYALDAGHAFMLGTLVGLLDQALRDDESSLAVSPVTDQQGNYLALVRFTLHEGSSSPFSWMMALVTE